MRAVFTKEIRQLFSNYVAWAVIAAFSLVGTLFLFFFDNSFNLIEIGTASLQSFFVLAPWIFIVLMPALGMKSFAEEQQNGTLQWLFAQPIGTAEVVLGKFFPVWLLGVLCLVPSLLYVYTIYTLAVPVGNIDTGMLTGSYIGSVLLIGTFAAVSLLTSALSGSQITAYLTAVLLNFILYFGTEQLASYKLLGSADYFLQQFSLSWHYQAFARGVVDSSDISFFLFIIVLLLALCRYVVGRKKIG
ncbi:MAG: gliding motility protein Gldf [Chryseobacterium sp.]|nr:MAG: gliding motility protein Gldf [Chryseobacterium sp.]